MTTAFAQLQFLPSQILEFEELSSTNDYLKDLASDDSVEEGTLVWALHQTNGKGQHSNRWLSEYGKNLTLSLLLKPKDLALSELFRLSKAISLAVRDSVSSFINVDVSIKWPNDILVDTQKIAGILIENSIQGDKIKHCIVGIGLNVNQNFFLSENNPTSLQKITGNIYSLRDVLNVLLENISSRYLQLQLKNYKNIDTEYFQHLFKVYTEQKFIIGNETKESFINEVLPDGSIVLTINGEKKTYSYGEARWKI